MDEESEGASSSLTVYSRENGDMSNKKRSSSLLLEHSPKAYGLIKVTASKFSLLKVETMRKSYYLNDNIF